MSHSRAKNAPREPAPAPPSPEGEDPPADLAPEPVQAKEPSPSLYPPPGTRRVVAVGDLHGDYHRLVRVLDEHGLIRPEPLSWNPEARGVDLVLIGDYVDWRGEPQEGPAEEWPLGVERLVRLVMRLFDDARFLGRRNGFDCRLFPILGNHDQMMLDAAEIFSFLSLEQVEDLISSQSRGVSLSRTLAGLEPSPPQMDLILKFFNWFNQGGDATSSSFGGMEGWREAMEGPVGDFFRTHLLLGVVLNHRLYAHSLPDDAQFWCPLPEILALPPEDFRRAREAFLWGRRIWGFDAFTGRRCEPPDKPTVLKLLAGLEVDGAVVGHTPVRSISPVKAFDGLIINVDCHGIPGSLPYLEDYLVGDEANQMPPLEHHKHETAESG